MSVTINGTTGIVAPTDGIQVGTTELTTVSGNVGIGTSSPTRKLQVESSAAENAVYIKNTNATAGTNYGLLVAGGSNSSDYSAVFKDKSESELMRITGAGNVGLSLIHI